ncbi:FadR/GntR family transcriptional regulator [Geminicoccus roseus]|uniref:FadR/GntR family transcriptional regulator n=1 Tax=Geminicoccus roseus TaxID=404900 RepID=UPI0004035211|nr:FadR/GntR family transcriptional regulator [Geminicoccus roseus]
MKIDMLGRGPHLPSRIAAEILQQIVEERLKPGDRLPTEQALADSFGVSRNVVREAISRLRSDGIVQSRQGVGAFVVRSAANPTLRFDAEALSDRSAFLALFELRAILEIQAASLAARRRTDEQLAKLEQALDRMRGAEKWASGGVDADLEFHKAVAEATGNAYVRMAVSFLSEQVRVTIMDARARGAVADIVEITIAEHAAIFDAIAARDPAAAHDAMALHIRNAAGRLGYRLDLPGHP